MDTQKKSKLSISKVVVILMLLSFVLTLLMPLLVNAEVAGERKLSAADKQKILGDLTKRKQDIATKLKEARMKEAYASDKLRQINQKLKRAQQDLQVNKKYLESNQFAFQKTRLKLEELNSKKTDLESEAKKRITSIYKQSRVKLLDGLINAPSATEYMDHVYYQRRVMAYDHKVLDALMNQSENMFKYRSILSQEAEKIKQVNGKLANLEKNIAAQRTAQKEVLTRLQNERRLYEEGERQLERESVKLVYKITELSTVTLDNAEATGRFIYPVKAKITSPFGPRIHPIFGVRSMHSGIDLAAPRGTAIKASEGGIVIYSGWYGGYGRVVIVDHSKGLSTLYAHLDAASVKVGDKVKQGQVVGYEGATGYATGPHLHFEVRNDGKPQNPVSFLSPDA
jgi:murein DD-endopeptidase MepM/ murein hydrolase activator NlpD